MSDAFNFEDHIVPMDSELSGASHELALEIPVDLLASVNPSDRTQQVQFSGLDGDEPDDLSDVQDDDGGSQMSVDTRIRQATQKIIEACNMLAEINELGEARDASERRLQMSEDVFLQLRLHSLVNLIKEIRQQRG